MKRPNRLLTFLLLVALMLGLVACQDNPEPPAEETLCLIAEGVPQVEIVYAASNNAAVAEATQILQTAAKEVCGKDLTAVSEETADQKKDAYQILIGATSFSAGKQAASELEANSYSITVSGKKIVLSASNDYLYAEAAKTLVKAFAVEDSTLSLAGSYTFTSETYTAMPFIKDGQCDYTIVYAAGDEDASTAAADLQAAIKTASGLDIPMTDDAASPSGKELLVGKTNRELSYKHDVFHRIALIQTDDSGSIALGGNLETSVGRFTQYIEILGAEGKDVELLDSMLGCVPMGCLGVAPLYQGGGTVEPLSSFEKSDSYYITIHEATREDYNGYTALLKEEGFTLHTSTEANGNIFEIWTDGYNILNLSHIAYTDPETIDMSTDSLGDISYMLISVDCVKNSALPVVETEIEDITTEQITAVGTQAGYVLRLSNGKFVIFDGGMPERSGAIYDILTKQNVREGKPVVAAWFMSHGHVDHIGALISFAQEYYNEVEVETFVHHLPAYELYYGLNTWEASSSNPKKHYVEAEGLYERSGIYYDMIKAKYPNAQIIVAHAGQRFEYGNIDIDVLFTPENIYRKQMYDTNMSSVVFSLTGDTGRMMLLGDSVDISCPMLNAIYEDTLKSDLVQVAHHGYNGGNKEMYANIAADYAIWSNSYDVVITRGLYQSNRTPRNKFDYKSVKVNIIPQLGYGDIVLSEQTTADQIEEYWGKLLP